MWNRRLSGYLTFGKFHLAASHKLKELPDADEIFQNCIAEALGSVSEDIFDAVLKKLKKYPNFVLYLQKLWKESHSMNSLDSMLAGTNFLVDILTKIDSLLPNPEILYKSRKNAKEWKSTVDIIAKGCCTSSF